MTESMKGTQKIGPASAGKALVRDDIYRPDCHPARTRKGEDAGPNESYKIQNLSRHRKLSNPPNISAMTAHAVRLQEGYTLNGFWVSGWRALLI